LLPYFSSWNPSLPPTGSDHTALTIILSTPLLKPAARGLNWKYKDWDHITPLLANLSLRAPPALPTLHTIDRWFDDSLAKITHLITSNTATKRPSSYVKPWWTPELTQLRCLHHTSGVMRKNQASPPSKLTTSFYNTFFLPDPLLPLPSSSLRLRTSPQFYHPKCPLHFGNLLTRQPLVQVAFLTLFGSGSIMPSSGSYHLCSLPSLPTDTTP